MKTLYNFLTSLCKDHNMKIEDLQKKLGVSRSSLYRYMKGTNQITQELAHRFTEALNMDTQEIIAFSKFISLSAFDQSLIESRYVIDDFLFKRNTARGAIVDIDMVFYNNDKYLRTLGEILDYIYSFVLKDSIKGSIRIINCLNDNIFLQITGFLEKLFAKRISVEVEHFVGLSERDYQQNAFAFINIFPLLAYEKYKIFFSEKEMEDLLMNNSVLFTLEYTEDGKTCKQFFLISFTEHGMPECIAFTDAYMNRFLLKNYESLKHSFSNVIQNYESFDFSDDVIVEMQQDNNNYMIKPNPCYDKIPYEVYESVTGKMEDKDLIEFMSSMFEVQFDSDTAKTALQRALMYIRRRIENSLKHKQIDVCSKAGLREFVATGKLTDHVEFLPAFNRDEVRRVIEYIRSRNNDPDNKYYLYVTEDELPIRDLVIIIKKDFSILIEYIYPESIEGLWKMLHIKSKRFASIFCDYIENYIPINRALSKEETDRFLQELIDSTME